MGGKGGRVVLKDIFVEEDCIAFGTADADGGGDSFYAGGEGEGVHIFGDFEEP